MDCDSVNPDCGRGNFLLITKFNNLVNLTVKLYFFDRFFFAEYKFKNKLLEIQHIAHICQKKFYNNKAFINCYILNQN